MTMEEARILKALNGFVVESAEGVRVFKEFKSAYVYLSDLFGSGLDIQPPTPPKEYRKREDRDEVDL